MTAAHEAARIILLMILSLSILSYYFTLFCYKIIEDKIA